LLGIRGGTPKPNALAQRAGRMGERKNTACFWIL
jgi:hypothetical protein